MYMNELKSLVTLLKAARSVEKQVERNIVSSSSMSLSEFMVMEALYSKGDDLPIQEIAKKVLLSSGTMTYVIDQLVKKGAIERINCTKDKRIIYAHLTVMGRVQIASAFKTHKQFIEELLSVLTEEEISEYIRLNKKVGKHASLGLQQKEG
jgi:MarR family 2-MHQ and catechol resistance regulon transcriptional repressor